jgi:DNA-binding SARP family transcriptional activator/tetratricopeptide (TPR) repeat protein
MSLLRLAVLGAPEVFHDGSRLIFSLRKAQALLLYLAVEGGMHSRSKLAALLWPDSEPHAARTGLRTALALLRSLLADSDTSSSQHSHLLIEHEMLGLNPHSPLELDLDVVQQAYQALRLPPVQTEQQRAALLGLFQHALHLVRGPFLDGFWLREETSFDAWVQQHRDQCQVRLLQLFDRLSSWQEAAGELEPVRATLTDWLTLDPLSEEAARRLMRVHLAGGDATAALQVYATLRARLAEELQAKPSTDTDALAEHARATATTSRGSRSTRSSPTTVETRPASELVAPLVGRATAFTQLVGSFQQVRQGHPQVVLVEGEVGIGKTRLARDFGNWVQAQGAEVLIGQAFEMGGRLPYQPLVEALRQRLEEENAPEDLLDDLWLAELSRLLPELRVRYPDLPAPTEDELTARLRLFEAIARLVDALGQRVPLVLLLDDLQWVDGASLDLLRYLGRHWIRRSSRVLLLGTMRSEAKELNPQLSTDLSNLGRDLPLTRIALQTLNQAETIQLLQAIAGEARPGTSSGGEQREHSAVMPATPGVQLSPSSETKLSALGDFLFAHTGGQPLYLLETLKLFRDQHWLVPRLRVDGTWGLEPTGEMTAVLLQKQSRRALLPPSVRAMILARLAKLAPPASQLVQASAVLGNQATAKLLWQLAEVEVQPGIEGLEEAEGLGILREEETGMGRPSSYRFAHELFRDVVYTELGAARRQVLHQRALALLLTEGTAAAELAYHAMASGETQAAYRYSMQAGDQSLAIFAVDDAIGHYEQAHVLLQEQLLRNVLEVSEVEHLYVYLGRAYTFQNAWQQAQQVYEELVAYAQHEDRPTLVSMTLNRLAILAVQQSKDKPQVRALLEEARGMAQSSSDQRALAETEWNLAQITAVVWEDPKRALSHGQQALSLALGWIHIRGGDFEEAIQCLEASLALYAVPGEEQSTSGELSLPSFAIGAPLTQSLTNRASQALCWAELSFALARTLPPTLSFQRLLTALGGTYHAVQQWEEARSTLEEAEVIAETIDLGPLRVPALSRLCMHYALQEKWEQAYRYAVKAIAVRHRFDMALISLDFSRQYETEALLHGGNERQAREEVRRLGERLGPYQRFRISYLRSLAVLATWHGHSEQAIGYLSEAAGLAADIGLPGEQWQIQALLGGAYDAVGEPVQAQTAYGKAAMIILDLAEGIKNEARRSNFLAGPHILRVLQRV